jgi:hypothetical protein
MGSGLPALSDVVAQLYNLLTSCLCEPTWYKRMNEARSGCSEELEADLERPSPVTRPRHPQRSRMICEETRREVSTRGIRFLLLYSHWPCYCFEPGWWPRQDSNLRPAV